MGPHACVPPTPLQIFLILIFSHSSLPPPDYHPTYLSVQAQVHLPQNNHVSLVGLTNDSFLSFLGVTKLAPTLII